MTEAEKIVITKLGHSCKYGTIGVIEHISSKASSVVAEPLSPQWSKLRIIVVEKPIRARSFGCHAAATDDNSHCLLLKGGGICGTVDSKPALRSAGNLMSRARAPIRRPRLIEGLKPEIILL
ncbi:hypothetical protein PoB_006243100 [Plakobranchus ocellatus]|uniref:Uncharacterized protein n=1 Tax=Plakobranchus ocellatus TaxID=259542 RepID=A0AAV4CW47_9GAST|nr:hypothetical protein PoB_006243100 [Plakobranchus ocellatus]